MIIKSILALANTQVVQDTISHAVDTINTASNVIKDTAVVVDKWKNLESAIEVTGKGMLGIFLFMFIFFFIIQGIDKLFPKKIGEDE